MLHVVGQVADERFINLSDTGRTPWGEGGPNAHKRDVSCVKSAASTVSSYGHSVEATLPSIVVIDDSPEVRALVTTRLQLSGRFSTVLGGANGVEAIGLAYRHRPSLLLLDLSMPVMDGLEALPGVLEVSPLTRVVIYTGFEERGVAEVARGQGASGFVEKSLPVDRLADVLLSFLPDEAALTERQGQPPHRRLSIVETARAGDDGANQDDQTVLDEHLESFRQVFDEAAIGMATMTLSGSVIRANRALADLMLCEPADLVGIDYGRLTGGRGAQLDAALDEIAHGLDLTTIEHDVTGWPEPRRARSSLAAVRDSRHGALYVFLQVQDITAQAAAEEQLRQSEERFRLLVEAVQEYAIFMLDPDGRVASWNSGAQRIKGYSAQEIIGQHFRVFYPQAQRESKHPEDELAAALRDGRYEEEGWRLRKEGTKFWASVLITAIFNDAGEHVGFAKVTRDTTERRRAENERSAYTAALASANAELESLTVRLRRAADDQSRFLAITAHEIRTPVAVLGGSADTLSRYWERLTDAERAGLLEGMTSSAARLQRLLRDLLDASRLHAKTLSVETTRIPVRAVLDSAVDAIRATDGSSDISVVGDHDLMVLADQDRLAQAIDNLLRNALRHGAQPVRLTAGAENGSVSIRVSDAGPGVSASVRPRLFERFATGDRLEGTGLGLFIAREIARAHGGEAIYEPASASYPAGVFVLTVPPG